MNKYWFLVIVVPLVLANFVVNVVFWAGHVEHALAQVLAAMWAVGLTAVEFLFPAWAVNRKKVQTFASWIFGGVGCSVAVFSVGVFAMTIDTVMTPSFDALIHQQKVQEQAAAQQKLHEEIAHTTLKAANIAMVAADRYNDANKISLGTMPAIDKFQELIHHASKSAEISQETPAITENADNNLAYIFTLSAMTGVSAQKVKVAVAFSLALVIEISAILSVLALMAPANVSAADRAENETNEDEGSTAHVPSLSHDTPTMPTTTPLERVRQDLLAGVHGKVPSLSSLPQHYQGTGLRYDDIQKLRDEMIAAGELVAYGKRRVMLALSAH